TYPDGSTEETPVKVTVTPNQAQENTPGYEDGTSTPGKPVTAPQPGDTQLLPGTKYEVTTTNIPEGWDIREHPDNVEVDGNMHKQQHLLVRKCGLCIIDM
ncbi:hypothetical protein DOS78_10490, partial [Staphylococcus felis]|uniref:hypothetical protein n=1 Tax=Staphylococcus felis TaxID=46127 RepID=UPI000E39AB89